MAKITAVLVASLAAAFVPFAKADVCCPGQLVLGYKKGGLHNGYYAMYGNDCGIIKKADGFCGLYQYEPKKGFNDFPFGKVYCDNKSLPTKVIAPDDSVFYPCYPQPKHGPKCEGDAIQYCCDRA